VFATENATETSKPIFSFQQDNKIDRFVLSSLAFQAGAINAGGFLACHRFVTHTTGFATQLGYDIAIKKWQDALGMLTVPLFFTAGSMISAFYIDRPMIENRPAAIYKLFLIISIFMLLGVFLGEAGFFGDFGQEFNIGSSYILIALLCLSSGIQNAVTTSASFNNIRTTHLTGHTTDLGISLIKTLYTKDSKRRLVERNKNQVRMLIILFFILGSVISSYLFLKYKYFGFLLPAIISIIFFILSKRDGSQHD
jgi:uncharacterized membrane protein YoaK (UPF0700 family)